MVGPVGVDAPPATRHPFRRNDPLTHGSRQSVALQPVQPHGLAVVMNLPVAMDTLQVDFMH
jgi:hypothetical protein